MTCWTLLQTLPAVASLLGRPRPWPDKLHANKGYIYAECQASLRPRDIQARNACYGVEACERLGRHRWEVERAGVVRQLWQAACPI